MITAILSGAKSQTRRVVNSQPPEWTKFVRPGSPGNFWMSNDTTREGAETCARKAPFRPGDVIYVRETMRRSECGLWGQYASDGAWVKSLPPFVPLRMPWWSRKDRCLSKSNRPVVSSLHMPSWASRIHLRIDSVGCERLTDISDEDAIAEGVRELPLQEDQPGAWWTADVGAGPKMHARTPKQAFAKLWRSIHGEDSWQSNPFVFVYKFTRVAESDAAIERMEVKPLPDGCGWHCQ